MSCVAKEIIQFRLATVEQDQGALPKSSEHYGASGICNCWRCLKKSVTNPETKKGRYQTGYLDGSAFKAERKTNQEARKYSKKVAAGKADPIEYGIRKPSIFAKMFPKFDIIYGYMIDFFHKLELNCPGTILKDFILKPYKQKEGRAGNWVMDNRNRLEFQKRISSLRQTHDMKALRDPGSQHMKAHDWNNFIITSSVWAAQGLIPDDVLQMWSHFVNGYVYFLQSRELTEKLEEDAAKEMKNFAKAAERLLPINVCTISLHLAAVEAHLQVAKTGPVREAVSSWIERLNSTLVEQTQRRRICAVPEKSIIRGYLIELFVRTHSQDLVPLDPLRPRGLNQPELYDDQNENAVVQLLGKGAHHKFTKDERKYLRAFLDSEGLDTTEVPLKGVMFKRARYRSEIHSEAYNATRKTCSNHVAIVYEEDPPIRRGYRESLQPIKVVYFGTVHKFFKVFCNKVTFRLAYVTVYYYYHKKDSFGVPYINRKKSYSNGHIVQVANIDRKVIFAPGHPTAVLTVPEPYVRLA